MICYQRESVTAPQFADILGRSELGQRRPVDDTPRLQRMLEGADLIITARSASQGKLIGIARSLTDWSYACYLSDLAVDHDYQGKGIGKRLIDLVREHAGEESMCLLVSASDSVDFYHRIGMPSTDRAFLFPRAQ